MSQKIKEVQMAQFEAQNVRAQAGQMTDDVREERDRVGSRSAPLSFLRRRIPKKYSFWVDVQLAKIE